VVVCYSVTGVFTAVMTSTAVTAAGVAFTVMVMMIALCVGIIGEGAGGKAFNGFIGISVYACEQFDTGLGKCHLGTAANTAADKDIGFDRREKSGKGTVSAAVCINHMGRNNFSILNGIDFELFGMTEMLEYLSVFIGYCNFHKNTPLAVKIERETYAFCEEDYSQCLP